MVSKQVEEEMQKKENLQNELSHHLSEINRLKGTEKQLIKEAKDLQHLKKMLEEEVCKLRTSVALQNYHYCLFLLHLTHSVVAYKNIYV